MIFQHYPYLTPGLHNWSLQEVDANLGRGFTGSQTRKDIAEGYSRLIGELARVGLRVEQWLDGSFCSAEPDPGDLDLVSLIDKDALDNLSQTDQAAVEKLFLGPTTRGEFLCDSYPCVILPPDNPNYGRSLAAQAYWREWFGFDRWRVEKGIVQVEAGLGALYPGGA